MPIRLSNLYGSKICPSDNNYVYVWFYNRCALKFAVLGTGEWRNNYSNERSTCIRIEIDNLIENILRKNKIALNSLVEPEFKYAAIELLDTYELLNGLTRVCNKNSGDRWCRLSESQILESIKSRELQVVKVRYSTVKADLQYIVGMSRVKKDKDYIRVELKLKSEVERKKVIDWCLKNKKEIYDYIRERYDKNKHNINYPLNCYEIGNISLLKGNILLYTFQLKKGLRDIENDMNKLT